jgi:hypothetical protein
MHIACHCTLFHLGTFSNFLSWTITAWWDCSGGSREPFKILCCEIFLKSVQSLYQNHINSLLFIDLLYSVDVSAFVKSAVCSTTEPRKRWSARYGKSRRDSGDRLGLRWSLHQTYWSCDSTPPVPWSHPVISQEGMSTGWVGHGAFWISDAAGLLEEQDTMCEGPKEVASSL